MAIPSYRTYVIRSQRSDAKDALLALATQQEKHYLQCNTYAAILDAATDCAAGELQATDVSKNGWYDLDVPAANATAFIVRATAVNGEFVARHARAATQLSAADRVEIVAPRQGG